MNGRREHGQAPVPPDGSLYSPEAVQDVAASMGLPTLPEELVQRLAKDVEYRIHQVIEEAARFTRHGKRTSMSPSDIDQALQALNIEPLYGHLPHMPTGFRRVVPTAATSTSNTSARSNVPVYFLEDEEIDFDKALRDEKVILPKMVSWHAHWLAVEGIQPLTIDNPPRPPLSEQKARKQSPPRSVLAPVPASSALQPGAQNRKYKPTKHVLSRELQIYYSRLNAALLPTAATTISSATQTTQSNGQAAGSALAITAGGEDGTQAPDPNVPTVAQQIATVNTAPTVQQQQQAARRAAALASLQYDAGLQNLLPYIVRWVGQSVVTAIRNSDGSANGSESERRQRELAIAGETLEVMLKVIHALIQNERLFIEPYLHQILPPLLSILLTASLPPSPPTLRRDASEILAYVSLQHGTTYPSLSERLTKTLLLALLAPSEHPVKDEGPSKMEGLEDGDMDVDAEGGGADGTGPGTEQYDFFEGRMHGSSGSREGAVRGLASLSPQAVERGLIESAGARIIGAEARSDSEGEVGAVLDALEKLKPRSKVPVPLGEMDGDVKEKLDEVFGSRFARIIGNDSEWARNLLGMPE